MSFCPGFGTAKTGFFGTADDDADFGVLEFDAFIVEGLQDGDAHLTAGEVVVGTVDDVVFVPQEVKADEERNKGEAVDTHLREKQSGGTAEDAAVLDHGGD